ncbi:DUF3288 family protein [Phormidium sp. CCY1219]|uniref:DUF3288 family protein n=1 Tax=Phormidium sp. CCY1219 TaxID=2886104 RepID=UPI002D1F06F0|nr:DUF3288 family protein [Phormidium sp. CCY1219]MEB3830725.1 DUF3288 family protein [Phormidium sp. CCY1219]
MAASQQDQQHPQGSRDREIVSALLTGEPSDRNLAELGRLRIRYRGFPGEKELWANLEQVLQRWNMTEEMLFEKTREIHSKGRVYRIQDNDSEDWM